MTDKEPAEGEWRVRWDNYEQQNVIERRYPEGESGWLEEGPDAVVELLNSQAEALRVAQAKAALADEAADLVSWHNPEQGTPRKVMARVEAWLARYDALITTKETPKRKWTGPGYLEQTGYIDAGEGVDV